METNTQNDKWLLNYDYIESQFNNLVRTGERYSFCIHDEYGNKTNYFNVNQNQIRAIETILKNL
jgi:hypothetical protein